MTGIDDLIICPRCLKPMGDNITVTTCQYCGYKEGDNLNDERAIEEEKIKNKIIYLRNLYELDYKDTPWYHNTANCIKDGKLDELEDLLQSISFDEESVGCYLGGRMTALKELRNLIIFGDRNGRED